MSQDLAERYGVPYFRSAVGEANVVDAMLAHGAVFGGEGNGGPIDPRVGYVRDSFVGMAQLLDAMAARQMTIGQLADELPRYEIVKTKISLAAGEAAGRARCAGKAIFRRHGRPARRPAARLARPLALGPRQQHRADRPRDCRGPDGGGSVLVMRSGGNGAGRCIIPIAAEPTTNPKRKRVMRNPLLRLRFGLAWPKTKQGVSLGGSSRKLTGPPSHFFLPACAASPVTADTIGARG